MGAGGAGGVNRIALDPMDFERLGRLRGEVLAHENAALQARVRMLEAEVEMVRAQLSVQGPAATFDRELARLAAQHGFNPEERWQQDPESCSLIRIDGGQG
jgi:hypothetical protein